MKKIKAPKVEPVVETIKVKSFKPKKVVSTLSRTKKKAWNMVYTVGKKTYTIKEEFAKLEDALGLLNCIGILSVQDEKGNKIQLV